MNFISFNFIVFLVLFLCGYIICPSKYRYIFLLSCNFIYLFSYGVNLTNILYLIFVILCTYIGALLLERCKQKKAVSIVVISLIVIGLFVFKYFNFMCDNYNYLIEKLGLGGDKVFANVIAPIGISFYSFQAIGYFIDVYREKIKAEKNLLLYAAFVSFFPTILSGPIERTENLLEQIKNTTKEKFDYSKIKNGVILMLWGGFTKLVIADRLAVLIGSIFNNYSLYGGFVLLFGAIAYTLQIYCDFYAYSIQAVGLGKILGFELKHNFDAPYFSMSIKEFWRRWHISLSTWFRDYLYIPLGGNRCSKLRKNINLTITFLVSGLWHGANWTFVFWGGIHAVYQIVGEFTQNLRKKINDALNVDENKFSYKFGKIMGTFLLVSFAWIFFRADTIQTAFNYIRIIFTNFQMWDIFNLSIYELGLDVLQINILAISLLVFIVVDMLKYILKKNVDEMLLEQNSTFIFFVCSIIFFAIFVFGLYGPAFNSQEFIYVNF